MGCWYNINLFLGGNMTKIWQDLIAKSGTLLGFEEQLFWLVVVIYSFAALGYFIYLFAPRSKFGDYGHYALLMGALAHTILIVFRGFEAGRAPFQTLYESLSWFGWSIVITYLVVERFYHTRIAGFLTIVVAIAGCVYALLKPSHTIRPLFPALQSLWFEWHVVIAFNSYAVFVVSFANELFYWIYKPIASRESGPAYGLADGGLEHFHRMAYKLILFGYPLLTFGIVSGAAWADQAWGRYWSWDPKETWSLITWIEIGRAHV